MKSVISKEIDIHDVIEILITTLNVRDNYTFQHSWRVAKLSEIIAQSMNLTEETIERVHQAAHLHDIGKIGVPDDILNKPGKLTKNEVKEIQKHSVIGYNILKRIPIFKLISNIVLYHHERYDGLGYPKGLKAEEIPLESRIIAVADAFDAITSDRNYRKAQNYDYAYTEINNHVQEQFCPKVVKHFNKVFNLIPDLLEEIESEIENNRISTHEIEDINHNSLFHSKKL